MAANTAPIFPLTPITNWVNAAGLVANTTVDLTAGTNYTGTFTAGTNGTRIDYVRCRALGTNTTTVIRIWLNNGGTTATAANNTLFNEQTLPSTSVTQTSQQTDVIVPMNVSIPTGYKVYYTFGTAVAAGYDVILVAGDY